ncbi:hypothetical protein BKA56DRAFT_574985 [Ilyonectria sp. MPI-CAGE-AT-0026]|nr:hypothetical protein BKA56DRAFT_574985 [Ilyonectria sp. MPI-CAGE-AT-0026]
MRVDLELLWVAADRGLGTGFISVMGKIQGGAVFSQGASLVIAAVFELNCCRFVTKSELIDLD